MGVQDLHTSEQLLSVVLSCEMWPSIWNEISSGGVDVADVMTGRCLGIIWERAAQPVGINKPRQIGESHKPFRFLITHVKVQSNGHALTPGQIVA
jgi:hypothetical protein